MSAFKKIDYSKKKKPLFEPKVKKRKIEYDSSVPNIEKDAEKELTELEIAFRERVKDTNKIKDAENNTEYWSCIIFENQEQRDRFYELLGVKTPDNQYISGKKLIRGLELSIETGVIKPPKKFNTNKDILEMSIKPNF